MLVKAVLIDLDNTLYEYSKCNNAGLDAVITRLADMLNKPPELVQESFEQGKKDVKMLTGDTASSHSRFLYFQKTIESLKGKTDVKLTQEIHNLFWDAYFKEMEVFDGVIEFFEHLKSAGIKIGIVTNLTAEIQFKKVAHLRLENYIDFVITSEEAGRDKPAEPIFLLALEKFGLTKEDVVVIGNDPDEDVQGAKNIGMRYILVNNGKFKDVLKSFKNLNSL